MTQLEAKTTHFSSKQFRRKHSNMCVGDLSIPNFVTVSLNSTVREAIRTIRSSARHGIFYVYVVDHNEQLCGVVSVRALLVAPDDDKIAHIYAPKVLSLRESTEVEEAYKVFSRAKFLSLPVVNANGTLTGVLHAHELIDEYEKELEELFEERTRGELFELLGIEGQEAAKPAALVAFKRLPWLLINLIGGAVSAFFIHDLADGLQNAVLYLAFVPILLIITESMGMQTLSIVIGHLNRNHPQLNIRSLFFREIFISLVLSLSCASFIALPVYFWTGDLQLSKTIALTMVVGFLLAATLSHIFPMVFHKMRIDPQIAAGPVVLAIADASTLVVFLLIALWFN